MWLYDFFFHLKNKIYLQKYITLFYVRCVMNHEIWIVSRKMLYLYRKILNIVQFLGILRKKSYKFYVFAEANKVLWICPKVTIWDLRTTLNMVCWSLLYTCNKILWLRKVSFKNIQKFFNVTCFHSSTDVSILASCKLTSMSCHGRWHGTRTWKDKYWYEYLIFILFYFYNRLHN